VKDLARALSVVSIRVVETIPGKSCMGLELPNPRRQIVKLVEILVVGHLQRHREPAHARARQGHCRQGGDRRPREDAASARRGHDGSGKSVAVNAMILSLLYKAEPRQVRMILVDPKMLELSVYEGIPHLLAPVVTDMKLARTRSTGASARWSAAIG
jgi:S-DNA-T family DNA segregation ATPase FtsK/SpoIIIE